MPAFFGVITPDGHGDVSVLFDISIPDGPGDDSLSFGLPLPALFYIITSPHISVNNCLFLCPPLLVDLGFAVADRPNF